MDFLDLRTVLPIDEPTCTEELHKEPHVVPCKEEHEREGHEISQRPPETDKNPKEGRRDEHTQRDCDQCTDRKAESTDEHLILDHLLEEDLRKDEKESRRYD